MLTTWVDFLACNLAAPQEDLTSAYAASAMCQPQNLSPFSFHCRFSTSEFMGVWGINNRHFQLGLQCVCSLQRTGLGSSGVQALLHGLLLIFKQSVVRHPHLVSDCSSKLVWP